MPKALTEEEKAKRKMERAIAEYNKISGKKPESETPPLPPPKGYTPKGGKGVENKNAEINRNIVRHVKSGLKHDTVDTYDAEAVATRFYEYLDACEADGIVPSMEGMYLWLGMDKSYFSRIINRGDSWQRPEAVVETFKRMKEAMATIVSSAADVGSIAPTTAVMKLTNSFGYMDVKQVQHIDVSTPRIGIEDDLSRLAEKYKPSEIGIIETDAVDVTLDYDDDISTDTAPDNTI